MTTLQVLVAVLAGLAPAGRGEALAHPPVLADAPGHAAVAGRSAATPAAAAADTVVRIRPGDRVVFDDVEGRLSIGPWSRSEMEVRTDAEGAALTVRRSGSTVRVEAGDRKGRRRSVEMAVRLPPSVDVEVDGRSLDVMVEGMDGRIDVDNVSGDVWIEGAGGPVAIRTIEGEVDVSRARAGVTASSQSDDVRIRDARGPVDAHSGDGDVELMDIRSRSVRVETQDGDIDFSGVIEDGGEYGFFVHDGDATIAIPADTRAQVLVSTFDGEFQSDFPVLVERFTGGREFDFTLGSPRARIEIQVFDGEIRLLERR